MDLFSNQNALRKTILLDENCEAYVYPDFFTLNESQYFFENLLAKINWHQDEIRIYGKLVKTPRLSAWYSDEGKRYGYSKIVLTPLPLIDELKQIKERVEAETGSVFNSVLLNLYRNGEDSMGWHRDNEPELGINPDIASVSFGATRIFKLRPYKTKTPVKSIELGSGSLLMMKGGTQHLWEHSVPKTKRVNSPRINLTFRTIV